MKIAMIGSGAAGSVFASYLRRGGADMTLVDMYKEHMDKIKADGMTFDIFPDESYQLTGFKTAYDADDIGIMDVVIFMTKATQLDAAVQSAKSCIGPDTVAVSLINGLGNDDVLLKYFPAGRIIIGSGVIGTQLKGPGHCMSIPNGDVQMNFGPIEHTPLSDKIGKYLLECFNKGGCHAYLRDEIIPFIWKKVIINSTMNTVCAVLRLPIGAVENDPYGKELFHRVIREACAVATAKNCPLDVDEFIKNDHEPVAVSCATYYPSMCQDVFMNRRQTEISVLNGKISEYGKQLGIPTPTNDLLTLIISAIQGNYDKQYQEK